MDQREIQDNSGSQTCLWQNWQTESWKRSCLLEPPTGSPLRTAAHVVSDSVLCVGNNNAIANEAWATKVSEMWASMTFTDKYDILGRPDEFHWHIFSGNPNHERNSNFLGSTRPCGFTGRITFMPLLNDIEWWTKDTEQTCLANATEVTEYAKQFKLGHLCFKGPGHEKGWYRSCSNKPSGTWDRIARKMTQIFEETSHQNIFLC